MVGGAGDERTLRWNREAFSHFRLRPRVLVDVSSVSTETTVLGTPVAMPALVAPMAFQQIAHEEGEVAMARGAGAAGALMCVSTVATATPAEIAEAAPELHAGYRSTSFATAASATRSSRRRSRRASRRSSSLPISRCTASAIASRVRASRRPRTTSRRSSRPASAEERSDGHHSLDLLESGLEWDYVTELCERWNVPVLVKGLVTAVPVRQAPAARVNRGERRVLLLARPARKKMHDAVSHDPPRRFHTVARLRPAPCVWQLVGIVGACPSSSRQSI